MKKTATLLLFAAFSSLATVQPISAQTVYTAAPTAVHVQRIVSELPDNFTTKSTEALSPVATQYSHGDPTAEEQLSLEYINRARKNPTEEGIRLVDTPDADVQGAISYFSISKSLVKQQFTTYPAQPPLAFNEKLIIAARKHSLDMKNKNFQGHTGSDGSDLSLRINREQYVGWTGAGENVAAYVNSVWNGHAGFNIDWGTQNQIDLGHRQNIMNFKGSIFTEIGVGIEKKPGAVSPQTGPMIITQDFGRRNTIFVCGVVYKDNNNNGFYDLGEGVSGVKITPSKGDFYAVSSTSGGYAIPISGLSGSLTLTAEGGVFTKPVSQNVQLTGTNVKVDLLPNLPGVISLIAPPDMENIDKKSVELQWGESSKPAMAYHLQVSEDEGFAQLTVDDQTINATKSLLSNLVNGKTYHWKVRAQSAEGWGDFSLPYSFTVFINAPDITLVSPPDGSLLKKKVVEIVWNKAAPVERYKVQWGSDRFFFTSREDSTLTDTSKVLNDLEWDITYYWRAAAFSDGVWGNFSSTHSFTTFEIMKPNAPVVVLPPDKFVVHSESITFIWDKPTGGGDADRYGIDLSTEDDFSTIGFTDDNINDLTYTLKKADLQAEKTHYWRLYSINDAGNSGYTPVRSFSFPPSGVIDNVAGAENVRVSPLPTSQNAMLSFIAATAAQNVVMTITDAHGSIVLKEVIPAINVGQQSFPIQTRSLAAGMYNGRISGNGISIPFTFVLVR